MLHPTPYFTYTPTTTTHSGPLANPYNVLSLLWDLLCCLLPSFIQQMLPARAEYREVYKNRQDPCRTRCSSLSIQFWVYHVALPSEILLILPFQLFSKVSPNPQSKWSLLVGAPIELFIPHFSIHILKCYVSLTNYIFYYVWICKCICMCAHMWLDADTETV